MDSIDYLKQEIFINERLSVLGLEIYESNKEEEFLHNAVYFGSTADKFKKVLKEEYGVIYECEFN